MNRDDLMTAGGASPRRNLKPEVRAMILLGALSYTGRSNTVALAKLMNTSTRTIKRAMSALEAEDLVVGARYGSRPTVWHLNAQRTNVNQRHELRAMLLAWLAVQEIESIGAMDVWSRLTQRAWHYARTEKHLNPRIIALAVSDETRAFAREREQALESFFQEMRANG